MKKKFLICILQHRDAEFAITAFLHLHAALHDQPELAGDIKIVLACTSHDSKDLASLQKTFCNKYDIDLLRCTSTYKEKLQEVFQNYPVEDFEYFIKHDEDVFPSAESWKSFLTIADSVLTDPSNFLLSVNLSTGIPRWHGFASVFMTAAELNKLKSEMALTRIPHDLWGMDYSTLNEFIGQMPSWDEEGYWNAVKKIDGPYKGVHPVRLNIEIVRFINSLIVSRYGDFQRRRVSHAYVAEQGKYFCNSFFCMPYARYQKVFGDASLYVDVFDEVPVNRYASRNLLNFCYVQDSMAIHILYNSVYRSEVVLDGYPLNGGRLEYFYLRKYFDLINLHLRSVDSNPGMFNMRKSWFETVRKSLRKKLAEYLLTGLRRVYRPY